MANLHSPSSPSRAQKPLGAWLALLAALGLLLASGHGLHAHERPDLRSDLPHWTASDGRAASGPADLHDGAFCNACRVRSESKLAIASVQTIVGQRFERSPRPSPRSAPTRATGRWQDAPAPPRAPPSA